MFYSAFRFYNQKLNFFKYMKARLSTRQSEIFPIRSQTGKKENYISVKMRGTPLPMRLLWCISIRWRSMAGLVARLSLVLFLLSGIYGRTRWPFFHIPICRAVSLAPRRACPSDQGWWVGSRKGRLIKIHK